MKKVLLIIMISLLLVSGCEKKEEAPKAYEKDVKPIEEEKIIEPEYIDDNPIKLAFYLDNGANWNKVTEYRVTYQPYTDINWFNIFLTDADSIPMSTIKNNWNDAYNQYENIADYRIGYEISFKTKDGKEMCETVTKPKEVVHFSFYEYLYMWVYDDVNATDYWYDHLEENEYNEYTQMSSVKFMATELTHEVDGPINIKVFTYNDDEDFDPETGRYRGNSYATLQIMSN